MLLLFDLSGEHPTLPVAELRGIMEAEKIEHKELYHNRIAIFEAKGKIERIAERAAMTHGIYEIISWGDEKELKRGIRDTGIEGSFKIEVENFDRKYDSFYLKKEIGKEMERLGGKVDLKKPDAVFKIFSHGILYLTKQLYEIDRSQYEKRKEKPFELPITMHPRLARAMVNIARLRAGDVMADPFCGTGAILVEAFLVGARVIGVEAKKWIAEGCRDNLAHFGVDGELHIADMRDVELKVDAIVTDMPYGRASYVGGGIASLYKEAFRKFDEWIDSGYIMAGIANRKYIDVAKNYFDVVEIHPHRVHKSLTRFLCLFVKH